MAETPSPPRRSRRVPADYWRQGAELGWTSLLVDEEHGGGSISGSRPRRPDAGRLRVRYAMRRRARCVPTNVVAAALSTRTVRRARRRPRRHCWPAPRPRPGASSEPGRTRHRLARSGRRDHGRRRRARRPRVQAPGRVGRAGRPPARHRAHRRRPLAGARPARRRRRHGRAPAVVDLTRRFAAVDFDDVRVPATALRRRGRAAPRRQSSAQLQLGARDQLRRIGRRDAGGFDMTVEWAFDRYSFGRPLASYQELKHRFADMKTWLEASHAISDARRGRRSPRRPRRGRARQRGQGVHRPLRRRAAAGLRADPRRHRRHLRARPAPVPPARAPPTDRTLRHARRAPPRIADIVETRRPRMTLARPTSPTSTGRRIRRELPAPGPAPGSRTTCKRSDPAAHIGVHAQRGHRRGRAGRGPARARAPAHALRRRARRHLRPARVRRPGPHPAAPAGAQRGARRLRVPAASAGRRRSRRASRVLLEFGTEEQKLRHIPAILKGEELWMQFLSEPSGGSDVAGALTTAVRDGDEWVLNGSKIWTTGAWWSDWGLCLARTNWDVPKHRGLTVFMLPLHQPGIEVHRIEMLNGSQGVLPGVPDRRPRARQRPHRRRRRRLDRRHPLDVPRADGPSTRRTRRCRRVRPAAVRASPNWSRSPAMPAGSTTRRARPDRRGPHARPGQSRPCSSASARASPTRTMSDQSASIARLLSGVAAVALDHHRLRARRRRRRGVGRATTARSPSAASTS